MVLVEFFIIRLMGYVIDLMTRGTKGRERAINVAWAAYSKAGMPLDLKTVDAEWIANWPITALHMTGSTMGALAFFGVVEPNWGFALTRHGALLEMGYELGDFVRMYGTRWFVENGTVR